MVVNIFALRLSISSVLSQIAGDEHLTKGYRDKLNAQCEHVFEVMYRALWIVVLLAAVFYSLFLFDIIGDDMGWRGALWAPLTLTFTALVVYLLYCCNIHDFVVQCGHVMLCWKFAPQPDATTDLPERTESGGLEDGFRPSSMFEIESPPTNNSVVHNPVVISDRRMTLI
jgi:hypothetical protein